MVDSCGCYKEWMIWLRETGRSYFRIFFVNYDRASIGVVHVCQMFRFNCSDIPWVFSGTFLGLSFRKL